MIIINVAWTPNQRIRMMFEESFYIMHLADTFIQSNLQCIQAIHYCIIMCVPWELNPQPFALQTQCSTAEARETRHVTLKTGVN